MLSRYVHYFYPFLINCVISLFGRKCVSLLFQQIKSWFAHRTFFYIIKWAPYAEKVHPWAMRTMRTIYLTRLITGEIKQLANMH